MYPFITFPGTDFKIDLFTVWIAVGIIVAIFLFIKLCQKGGIENKVINFYINILLFSIALGFLFAVLFQAFYNWVANDFVFDKDKVFVGFTFLGGLIGGVATFFILFLIFKKPQHQKVLMPVCCNILTCIALAHCFGRIGCTFAGCCYGKVTTAWFGINFHVGGDPLHTLRIPTQLFEAIFLLILFFVMLKFRKQAYMIYPMGYGVFRFFIEFLRDDARGDFIPGISPSQAQSLLLIAIGIALIILTIVRKRKDVNKTE